MPLQEPGVVQRVLGMQRHRREHAQIGPAVQPEGLKGREDPVRNRLQLQGARHRAHGRVGGQPLQALEAEHPDPEAAEPRRRGVPVLHGLPVDAAVLPEADCQKRPGGQVVRPVRHGLLVERLHFLMLLLVEGARKLRGLDADNLFQNAVL